MADNPETIRNIQKFDHLWLEIASEFANLAPDGTSPDEYNDNGVLIATFTLPSNRSMRIIRADGFDNISSVSLIGKTVEKADFDKVLYSRVRQWGVTIACGGLGFEPVMGFDAYDETTRSGSIIIEGTHRTVVSNSVLIQRGKLPHLKLPAFDFDDQPDLRVAPLDTGRSVIKNLGLDIVL
jgi:hypothetical protein